MLTRKQLEKRVDKGIALLNATKPNWLRKIKVASLNMLMPGTCILGQVYNTFYDGIAAFNPKLPYNWFNRGKALDYSAKYGFSFSTEDSRKYFAGERYDVEGEAAAFNLLGEIWRAKIKELRKVAK